MKTRTTVLYTLDIMWDTLLISFDIIVLYLYAHLTVGPELYTQELHEVNIREAVNRARHHTCGEFKNICCRTHNSPRLGVCGWTVDSRITTAGITTWKEKRPNNNKNKQKSLEWSQRTCVFSTLAFYKAWYLLMAYR